MVRQLLCFVLLLSACGQVPPPKTAPKPTAQATAPAKPKGPRIEWPTAYAQQVHFPLYLDDELPVCVQVSVPERTNTGDVLCMPLGVLRWYLAHRRTTH